MPHNASRVARAITRAQGQIDQASPAAIGRASERLSTGPDPIMARATVQLGVMRGQITAQEGAQLSRIALNYGAARLVERIALDEALTEIMGGDVRMRRALILEE